MRRPIGWIDRDWEGGRREVRVTFHGNAVKWQFLPNGAEDWDYESIPTEENWRQLEQKLADLWQRGHMCKNEIELVKRRGIAPGDSSQQGNRRR